jgi:CheY-like chemotaxis protein
MAHYGYLAMPQLPNDAQVEPVQAGKSRPTVLVVDDDPDIRDTVAEVLSEEGYSVQLAGNGREALGILGAIQAKPGLILLDLMMPELDGWGFMAEVEKLPALAAIPVIVFSAHSVNPEAVGALKLCGFLRKPLRLHELLELVGRCARS